MKTKSTLKKIGIISFSILLSATLAIGVMALTRPIPSVDNEAQSPENTATTTATNISAQIFDSITENYIGEEEAKAIALAHARLNEADVSHMLCKLDYDDGIAEYEVEIWDGNTEFDYEINAISGEIIGYDYDMESYYEKPTVSTTDTITQTEYIGEEEAKAIALAHAGVTESEAGNIKCEFDYDDGYAEYEVEWEIGRMEYEYTISATDGAIWEHDVEYDD